MKTWSLLSAVASLIVAPLAVAPAALAAGPSPEISSPAAGWTLLWERDVPVHPEAVVSLLVADLDGDGADDPVVVSYGRKAPFRAIALDGRTARTRWDRGRDAWVSFALSEDGPSGAALALAWGDSLELLSGADGRAVRALRTRAPAGDVAFAEIDGDGTPDLVYTAGKGENDLLVAVSGASWRDLWVRRTEPDDGAMGEGFGAPAALDLDADGLDEVLVTERMNTLTCLDRAGGARWSVVLGKKTRYLPEGVASTAPVAADLARGAPTDVAVGCFAGALLVLDGVSGEAVARMQFGLDAHAKHAADRRLPAFIREILGKTGEPISELLTEEVDGRAGADLVFGSSDGFVYAVSPRRGETLWRFDSESEVYDRCIALHGEETFLIAWDVEDTYILRAADGALAGRLPFGGGASDVASGDLNGDGVLDVVAAIWPGTRVRAWSTGVPAARP